LRGREGYPIPWVVQVEWERELVDWNCCKSLQLVSSRGLELAIREIHPDRLIASTWGWHVAKRLSETMSLCLGGTSFVYIQLVLLLIMNELLCL
jgi:hypothetical protein